VFSSNFCFLLLSEILDGEGKTLIYCGKKYFFASEIFLLIGKGATKATFQKLGRAPSGQALCL
jgi:hypothetical protein